MYILKSNCSKGYCIIFHVTQTEQKIMLFSYFRYIRMQVMMYVQDWSLYKTILFSRESCEQSHKVSSHKARSQPRTRLAAQLRQNDTARCRTAKKRPWHKHTWLNTTQVTPSFELRDPGERKQVLTSFVSGEPIDTGYTRKKWDCLSSVHGWHNCHGSWQLLYNP